MKKIALALLIAVCGCLFVSGCNDNSNTPTTPSTNAPVTTNAVPK